MGANLLSGLLITILLKLSNNFLFWSGVISVALTGIANNLLYSLAILVADIPAFSMVGFSYGLEYFTHPEAPSPRQVFPNGELLESGLCYWTGKQKPEEIYSEAVGLYRKHNYR